ncbi:MAG: response regulator transcription factor [Lachnospiraceae bacterium]|nr:response regulator transcription factor [Lachnospiraceae bacterium]
MYIAVCEDHNEELKALLDVLDSYQQERNVSLHLKSFSNADEMLTAAKSERFTLYILDIMMPGIDGIAAARDIRSFDISAKIVFLTSTPAFAYQSYGVKAMDYLLKPITKDILFPVLDSILREEEKLQESLTIKTSTSLVRIPFSKLVYVEVINKHLYFNLSDGTVREIPGAMKDYEDALLSRPEFMRTHRSYIVNMLQIAEFSLSGIRTFTGKSLPVSRLMYSQLKKDYVDLLFAEEGE